MAERLEVKELKSMLDFAKELADKRRGRFIFVLSPTDELATIGDFGAVSRADAIHIGDLSDTETTAFLTKTGCAADRCSALYTLIGGHLPHLVTGTVLKYCRGAMTLADVEGALFAEIAARVGAADRVLGIGSACGGLCGVETKVWPKPGVLDVLVKKHLVVEAIKKDVFFGLAAGASVCECPLWMQSVITCHVRAPSALRDFVGSPAAPVRGVGTGAVRTSCADRGPLSYAALRGVCALKPFVDVKSNSPTSHSELKGAGESSAPHLLAESVDSTPRVCVATSCRSTQLWNECCDFRA